MPNAAAKLADILQEWSNVSAAPTPVRRESSLSADFDFWPMHRYAVALIEEIEQHLRALHAAGIDVSDYRESVDVWTRAVFEPETYWSQGGGTRHAVSGMELRILRLLAKEIDREGLEPNLDASVVRDLPSAIDEAEAVLRDSDELNDEERLYIAHLLAEARLVASNPGMYSTNRVRSLSVELGGFCVATGARVGQKNADQGRNIFRMGLRFLGFASKGAATALGSEGASAAIGALTS